MKNSRVNHSRRSTRNSRSTRKMRGGVKESPFIRFARANRPLLEIANPHSALGEKSRILALQWKNMSAAEKSVYASPKRSPQPSVANTGRTLRSSTRKR